MSCEYLLIIPLILCFCFFVDYQVNRQYKFVKDQFEVVPHKDLLIVEGFIPPPKGHSLEATMVDLTKLESNVVEVEPEVAAPVSLKVKTKPKSSKKKVTKPKPGSGDESS